MSSGDRGGGHGGAEGYLPDCGTGEGGERGEHFVLLSRWCGCRPEIDDLDLVHTVRIWGEHGTGRRDSQVFGERRCWLRPPLGGQGFPKLFDEQGDRLLRRRC